MLRTTEHRRVCSMHEICHRMQQHCMPLDYGSRTSCASLLCERLRVTERLLSAGERKFGWLSQMMALYECRCLERMLITSHLR